MLFSIKSSEDIDRKILSIKEEIAGIKINNYDKDNPKKIQQLNRLVGHEMALRWVLGKGVI